MPPMTDAEIVKVALQAVPKHLHPLAHVARRHDIAAHASGASALRPPPVDPVDKALAALVGAEHKEAEPDSADVEFSEETPLGHRTTVVHVRNGVVTHVLKRG